MSGLLGGEVLAGRRDARIADQELHTHPTSLFVRTPLTGFFASGSYGNHARADAALPPCDRAVPGGGTACGAGSPGLPYTDLRSTFVTVVCVGAVVARWGRRPAWLVARARGQGPGARPEREYRPRTWRHLAVPRVSAGAASSSR